jgi:hypothetical protein
VSTCTECGADLPSDQDTCPRCHRPRWYTLKKISIFVLVIVTLMIFIKYVVVFGDRTLSQWFG